MDPGSADGARQRRHHLPSGKQDRPGGQTVSSSPRHAQLCLWVTDPRSSGSKCSSARCAMLLSNGHVLSRATAGSLLSICTGCHTAQTAAIQISTSGLLHCVWFVSRSLMHPCAHCALMCRQVSLEEGDSKARELSVNFIETSAKAGFNIKVSTCPPAWTVELTSSTDCKHILARTCACAQHMRSLFQCLLHSLFPLHSRQQLAGWCGCRVMHAQDTSLCVCLHLSLLRLIVAGAVPQDCSCATRHGECSCQQAGGAGECAAHASHSQLECTHPCRICVHMQLLATASCSRVVSCWDSSRKQQMLIGLVVTARLLKGRFPACTACCLMS